jgi:hypothetical protein
LVFGFPLFGSSFVRAFSLKNSQWYSDDCRDYDVQIFKNIENKTVSTCYSPTGDVDGTVGADIPLMGATFEDCATFERPANHSLRWFLEVVSVDP